MSNEMIENNAAAEKILDEKPDFKGYTLNDIRYRRAVVALKKEFARQKVAEDLYTLKHWRPFDRKSNKSSKAFGIAKKLMGGLNYFDYAMLGFSLFSSARKVLGFFRRK